MSEQTDRCWCGMDRALCQHPRGDAASRLTETKLPSSPAGEMGSEPVRKVLTRADIEKLNEGTHSCGWTIGAVKNPNPACGCMCGTVYAPDGRAILSHSGRHGMRCQHADERGNLLVPDPLGADISGPKGSGGAAPEASDVSDGPCKECGYSCEVWFAPNELWNAVVGPTGLVCLRCFVKLAEAKGFNTSAWKLEQEYAAPIAPVAQELVLARKVIVRGCSCYSSKQDDWHAENCPMPEAYAAIARAERKEGEAKPRDSR